MSDLEYKDFDAELELKGEDAGQFSAYFARFNSVDRVNDLIEPGAFKNLNDFMSDGWIGIEHNLKSLPIAMIDSAKQDDRGLLIAGRFHSHSAAQDCRSVIKERMASGKAVKCSIGYKVDESKPDKLNGKAINRLKAMRVFEASFVNLPANPAATVLSAKSLDTDGQKLISIDDLKAYLEVKAGRVISRGNFDKLKSLHMGLGDAHATLGSFLIQHDPDGGTDEPDEGAMVGGGGSVAGKAARLKLLRLRALRCRVNVASSLGSKA